MNYVKFWRELRELKTPKKTTWLKIFKLVDDIALIIEIFFFCLFVIILNIAIIYYISSLINQ